MKRIHGMIALSILFLSAACTGSTGSGGSSDSGGSGAADNAKVEAWIADASRYLAENQAWVSGRAEPAIAAYCELETFVYDEMHPQATAPNYRYCKPTPDPVVPPGPPPSWD